MCKTDWYAPTQEKIIMTRRALLTTLCICFAGPMACQYAGSTPSGDDAALTTTLRLTDNGAGELERCDASGVCDTIPNPDACATLVVKINNQTGETCERCETVAGDATYDRCEDTSIACTVVTAPTPDCVVCAHVGGSVIFSSCIPEEPKYCEFLPLPGTLTSSSAPNSTTSTAACRVCYDEEGNEILNECGNDCSLVSCAQILCIDGFRPARLPGDCCDVCVPIDDCAEIACTTTNSLPDCPDGTRLTRDPNDCCGYFCEPFDCSLVMCPAVELRCPVGTRPSHDFPNCCGTCEPVEPKYCMDDNECGPGAFCAKDDCYSNCDDRVGQNCLAVCYGLCKPDGHLCDPMPMDPTGLPYFECDGSWIEMTDEFGCPLPPRCICADGTVTWGGRCGDECANFDCMTIAGCPDGTHLENLPGHCCGTCIPDGDEKAQCVETNGRWDDTSCGHYPCGQQPMCEALIPGCDCGEGRTFREGKGCVEDANCSGDPCATLGGSAAHGDVIPDEDGCNNSTCIDGQLACTDMVCAECWGAFTDSDGACRSPNDGVYPADCCDEPSLCEGTGGTWDEASCGNYECGQYPACDAIIPGCDCGSGRNFDAKQGCYRDDTCAPKTCNYGSAEYRDGESFPANDGCNSCSCEDGSIFCTEMACRP